MQGINEKRGENKWIEIIERKRQGNELNLFNQNLSVEDIKLIFEAISNIPSITGINLSCNNIGYEGAKEIAKSLSINTSIKIIDLSGNNIGDKGAEELAKAIEINNSLTSINLMENNNINQRGNEELAKGLINSKSITWISGIELNKYLNILSLPQEFSNSTNHRILSFIRDLQKPQSSNNSPNKEMGSDNNKILTQEQYLIPVGSFQEIEDNLKTENDKIREIKEETKIKNSKEKETEKEIIMLRNQLTQLQEEIKEKDLKLSETHEQISYLTSENEELKYQLSQLSQYHQIEKWVPDDKKVSQIIGSVDSNFQKSANIIQSYIEYVNENKIKVSVKDANTILSCYLINKHDYPWETENLPSKITRGYLESKGAQIPSRITNQLRGNKNNHAKSIYKLFKDQDLLEKVDEDLLKSFKMIYNIEGELVDSIEGDEEEKSNENNNNDTNNNENNSNENNRNYNVRLNPDLFISKSDQNRAELIKLLINNSVLIMTGTGVSSSLTLNQNINAVSWEGLLNCLKQLLLGRWSDGRDNHFFTNWNNLNVFEKAAYLKEYATSRDIDDFRNYVLPLLGGIHPDNEPDIGNETSITTVLSALKAPIATTNYDILSEIKLNRNSNNMEPVSNLDDILENFNNYIFHIHGIFDDAPNIVLEENVDTWESFRLKIESYFPQKSILFVGCQYGALDLHFTSYYELYPNLKHYILLRREEFYNLWNDEKFHDIFARYLQRGSLNVIIYGDRYDELVPFLWSLVASMGIIIFPEHNPPPFLYFNCIEQRINCNFDGQQWNVIRTPYP